MITIYKAHLDDYEGFAQVEKEVSELHAENAPWNYKSTIGYSFSFEYYKEIMSKEDSVVYLAKEGDIIVGYVIAHLKQSEKIEICRERNWLFIGNLGVKSTHKKRGIGSLLIEKIEEYARTKGIDSIELSVWSFNVEAIEFYKKKGFEPFSIKMRKEL